MHVYPKVKKKEEVEDEQQTTREKKKKEEVDRIGRVKIKEKERNE